MHCSHSASKLAKQLLAHDQQNLLLWDSYARIERQRGKLKESRHVYIQTLLASPSFSPESSLLEPVLFKSWAEMEWEEGNDQAALTILLAAALQPSDRRDLLNAVLENNDHVPNSSAILRARQVSTKRICRLFI